jgi:hypothetical protein
LLCQQDATPFLCSLEVDLRRLGRTAGRHNLLLRTRDHRNRQHHLIITLCRHHRPLASIHCCLLRTPTALRLCWRSQAAAMRRARALPDLQAVPHHSRLPAASEGVLNRCESMCHLPLAGLGVVSYLMEGRTGRTGCGRPTAVAITRDSTAGLVLLLAGCSLAAASRLLARLPDCRPSFDCCSARPARMPECRPSFNRCSACPAGMPACTLRASCMHLSASPVASAAGARLPRRPAAWHARCRRCDPALVAAHLEATALVGVHGGPCMHFVVRRRLQPPFGRCSQHVALRQLLWFGQHLAAERPQASRAQGWPPGPQAGLQGLGLASRAPGWTARLAGPPHFLAAAPWRAAQPSCA